MRGPTPFVCAASFALVFGSGSPRSPAVAQESGAAATKANLDLPFDAGGEREEEEEAPEIIVFYGQQYEGEGFFFCADRSSSMTEGTKWATLKREMTKNISVFSERVQFGIVFFDATVLKFPTSGRPADSIPALKAAATSFVMSATTGYGSCVKEGLLAALTYANQSNAKRKVIIYLGDGRQTCPGHEEAPYGNETLNAVRAQNIGGAHINAICIGAPGQVDEAWPQKLASQNNGTYARVIQ